MISRAIGTGGRAITSDELRWLLLAGFALWVIVYATINFGLVTYPMEHQSERIVRRLVTCGAGYALCLAMVPALWRARSWSLGARIGIALGASALAYLAHLLVRLAVFHLYRPLWGALDLDVVLAALQGDGWMFALWAALCLLVFGETRDETQDRIVGTVRSPGQPSTLWSDEGRWRVKVPLESVLLFEAERDYVRLHTASKRHLVRARLKDLIAELPAEQYMQVHRSAIVQLAAIEGMRRAGSAWRIRLRHGIEARVSRTMGKSLRQRLKQEMTMSDLPLR
jgi:hypothetical protein